MTQSLAKLLDERKQFSDLTVEESIQAQGQKRYEHGLAKYGIALDRKDLTFMEWLEHHKQELMDAIRYVECQQRELELLGHPELLLGPQ